MICSLSFSIMSPQTFCEDLERGSFLQVCKKPYFLVYLPDLFAPMSDIAKQEKIQEALELMQSSGACQKEVWLTPGQWAGILTRLDEAAADELLLILREELEMKKHDETVARRKQATNAARLFQKMEKLKLSLEQESTSPSEA